MDALLDLKKRLNVLYRWLHLEDEEIEATLSAAEQNTHNDTMTQITDMLAIVEAGLKESDGQPSGQSRNTRPALTIRALLAEREALEAELVEARRRRDAWKAKAEGYDEVRLALREKVGTPWPPSLSRTLWAGIAADEKKRADDAEAEVERLREAVAEAVYMLDPEAEDVLKGAGIYRIVSAHVAAGGILPGDLKDALAQISTKKEKSNEAH